MNYKKFVSWLVTFYSTCFVKYLNDSHRKELFTQFSTRKWLLDCFWPFSYVYTMNWVLYISLSRIEGYRCLKNVIHQIDSKKEWLLLSARFTAQFRLVFVFTVENAFSLRFRFKIDKKSIHIFKIALVLEIGMFLCDNQWKFCSVFYTLALKQIVWKTKTFFKKLGYYFFYLNGLRLKSDRFYTKLPC